MNRSGKARVVGDGKRGARRGPQAPGHVAHRKGQRDLLAAHLEREVGQRHVARQCTHDGHDVDDCVGPAGHAVEDVRIAADVGGHGVVAHVVEERGGKQHGTGEPHGAVGHALLATGLRGVVLLDLVLADAHLETLLVHLLHQRRLLDQKAVHYGRHQHKGGLQQEERQVVGALHVGDHDRDGNQHDARAGVAHDLLHGVGLGAQRARRDVSHDGHRHGEVRADGKQRDQDGADKQR